MAIPMTIIHNNNSTVFPRLIHSFWYIFRAGIKSSWRKIFEKLFIESFTFTYLRWISFPRPKHELSMRLQYKIVPQDEQLNTIFFFNFSSNQCFVAQCESSKRENYEWWKFLLETTCIFRKFIEKLKWITIFHAFFSSSLLSLMEIGI